MSNQKNKTILFVEDDDITSIFTSKILQDFGYNVIAANSGEKAVEIVLNNKNINLILVDIELGEGIDGTEAASIILKDNNIPIIFLSSHADPEIIKKTEKISSYGYVMKSSSSFVLDASINMAFKLFEANKKIAESEGRYRTLIETQMEVVCVWLPDTTLTFVNEAYCHLVGKSREELTGRKWIDFIPENARAEVLENYKKAVAVKQVYSYVHEVEGVAGTRWYRWNDVPLFDKEGNLKYFQSVGHDITERKQIEDEIKEKSLFQKTLLDSIPTPVFYKDAKGRYLGFNKAYLEFFGKDESEIVGKTVYDISPKELADVYFEADNELFKNFGKQVYESQVKDARGQLHDVIFHKAVFYDASGKLGGLIGVILDITDIMQFESNLFAAVQTSEKFREKAEQATHEKELLLKEVHHRIKNNMNTVMGLLFLQADTIKDPVVAEALVEAGSRVHAMTILYDKLYRSMDHKKLSIKEYFSTLIDEIVINFPNSKYVKVEKNFDDIIISSKVLSSLGIIINELLTNIMKHAFTGRDDGLITVSAGINASTVTITIQDNGVGMPESVDFENSTGFGLKLVDLLAKQIGGSIRIERQNGTKYIIEFNI